jgi:hypothetical protein
MGRISTPFCLFDHLVGEGKHGGRDVERNRLGGFEIEDQFKLGRQLYGQVPRLFAVGEEACGSSPGSGSPRFCAKLPGTPTNGSVGVFN